MRQRNSDRKALQNSTCQFPEKEACHTYCRYTTSLLLFNKRFTRLGEMKILLESSSSNLKLDTGPRDSGTWLVMIKGR
jgi:hypothetical protein